MKKKELESKFLLFLPESVWCLNLLPIQLALVMLDTVSVENVVLAAGSVVRSRCFVASESFCLFRWPVWWAHHVPQQAHSHLKISRWVPRFRTLQVYLVLLAREKKNLIKHNIFQRRLLDDDVNERDAAARFNGKGKKWKHNRSRWLSSSIL